MSKLASASAKSSLLVQCVAAIAPRFGEVGTQGQCPVEALQGLVRTAQPVQCVAAICQHLREVRPQRQRPVERRQRLGVPFEPIQGQPAVVQRFGIVRPQRQRAIEAGKRRIQLPGVLQQDAAVVVRIRQFRRAGDRGIVVRQCFLGPVQRGQRDAEVQMRGGEPGVQPDRPRQQIGRPLVPVRCDRNQSQQVQHVGIARRALQDLAI